MEKVEYFTISQLTFDQKLYLMETIWDELTKDDEKLQSPAWHEEVLKDRKAALKAGKASVSDWKEAKARIRRNISSYKTFSFRSILRDIRGCCYCLSST